MHVLQSSGAHKHLLFFWISRGMFCLNVSWAQSEDNGIP